VTLVTLHDAEDRGANELFAAWRREHSQGYFINYGSPTDMMIHRVGCPHFIFREARNLTSYKKVCSESIEELRGWARTNGVTEADCCRTCFRSCEGGEIPEGGSNRLKDAAKRATDSARRLVEFSREKYEREKAYWARASMYPVVKFKGLSAHDDFLAWIEEYQSGYVINCASDDYFMLHRADCPHFVIRNQGYRLTKNMKVCCLRRDRLERWARWRIFAHLHLCSHCAV
jgi:hypothetical protein